MNSTDAPAAAEAIIHHASAVCEQADHLWTVLADVSIPTELLSDRRDRHKVTYDTEPMVRAFLYKEIQDISQNELATRLHTRPALLKAFGFDAPPRQQTLSTTWRAFDDESKRVIVASAHGIAHEAHEHEIIPEALVPSDPADRQDADDTSDEGEKAYTKRKATKTIRLARKHAFPAFDSGRAANRQYEDADILDMVARMCAHSGSANSEGEFGWLTDDDLTAHGSTILRALKGFATPTGEDAQLTVEEALDADRMPRIDRIRDSLMGAFDRATENILTSIRGDDPFDDRRTVAAIDITHERFYASPWLDKAAGVARPTFPRMVSGYKHDGGYRRGYKYATITLVGDCAPIILGIEPVKEDSTWEEDGAPSYSKAGLVERLLDRAMEYVDLDEVLFDRGFYSPDVYAAVEDRGLTYLSPVPRYEDELESIADIEAHPTADAAVKHDVPLATEGSIHHSAEFLCVPSTSDDAGGKYAVFVTNREHVATDEIEAVCNRYSRRWDIENQYKSLKGFMPRTSSTDYRVRLCNFVLTALLYNLWRLTDYLIKVGMDVPIRGPPEVTAKTFVRALGDFLRAVG